MTTPFYAQDADTKRDILDEASAKLGIKPLFLEKDYWVCLVLDILFHQEQLVPHLCFRGGTSLSKVYGVIERFSEDIDIELTPGFFTELKGNRLPCIEDTPSQRDSKHRKLRPRYREMMREYILPLLQQEFEKMGIDGACFRFDDLEHARDPYVLYIHYPTGMDKSAIGYVSPVVKLELSGRADAEPAAWGTVSPYIGRVFGEFASQIPVKAVLPERTFWEKAFILHEQNTRAMNQPEYSIPDRLARHYYDLDALIRKGHGNTKLFAEVCRQRDINYHYGWMVYEGLKPADMLILPTNDARAEEWNEDYLKMAPMLMHEQEPLYVLFDRIRHFWEASIASAS